MIRWALLVALAALSAIWPDALPPSVRPAPERAAVARLLPVGIPPPSPRVHFVGGDAAARPLAEAALRRVFETPIGRQARDLLDSGVLGGPLTIELNARGDNLTHYRVPGRELGRRIAFDPSSRPLVETERGLLPAEPETVLAHELGHAVFKLVSEEAVIHSVENPLREQLGLPRRRRF